MNPKILVIGSFVMDLITSTYKFPSEGETVLGSGFQTAPGGKGANQAMQAARLGAKTTLCGCVGNDIYGKLLLDTCKQEGIDVSHVKIDDKSSSAIGNIILQLKGNGTQNRIIVVPGANMALTTDDIDFIKNEISNYEMLMLQHEIPMEVNMKAAKIAFEAGVKVMLNPAPVSVIPDELYKHISYISPNEHEAAALTGIRISTDNKHDMINTGKLACEFLIKKGVQNAIITLGSNGAVLMNKDEFIYSESVEGVKVVDPTAAGDSFIGAFCTAISSGKKTREALEFANRVAAITVSRMGAMPSLPTLEELGK